ncbi:hypothetical protein [Clostridium sp. KNHs205]|jgi:hypothetical protein|nr:hypothetical protein [Clostridium sp. KNHs205]
MDGIFYGAVFLCNGIFLLFFSGKEKKNMLRFCENNRTMKPSFTVLC